MDDNRHSWNIISDMLVAIEKEGNSSAGRITTRRGRPGYLEPLGGGRLAGG
jgi:hypothetical protein